MSSLILIKLSLASCALFLEHPVRVALTINYLWHQYTNHCPTSVQNAEITIYIFYLFLVKVLQLVFPVVWPLPSISYILFKEWPSLLPFLIYFLFHKINLLIIATYITSLANDRGCLKACIPI